MHRFIIPVTKSQSWQGRIRRVRRVQGQVRNDSFLKSDQTLGLHWVDVGVPFGDDIGILLKKQLPYGYAPLERSGMMKHTPLCLEFRGFGL